MSAKDPVQRVLCVQPSLVYIRSGDLRQDIVLYRIRGSATVPNPVEAKVGRDSVEEAGRMVVRQAALSSQQLDEHILRDIQGLVFIP